MKKLKKQVSFLDKDGHRAKIEAEITERNGYPEFTASGTFLNAGGQVLDEIKPANEHQAALINLWKLWHLNGMNAGTPKQEQAIKEWLAKGNKYDFTAATNYLKSKRLYTDKHPKTGKPYKYGNGWLIKDLPDGFDDILINIIDNINIKETERESKKEQKQGDEKILELMAEHDINETELDACRSYLDITGADDLADFQESYQGHFSSDEEFAKYIAEELGAMKDEGINWPYTSIDWERAARELMMDYSEQDDHYFRNL